MAEAREVLDTVIKSGYVVSVTRTDGGTHGTAFARVFCRLGNTPERETEVADDDIERDTNTTLSI